MHSIPYEFKIINYMDKAGNDYLKSVNPISKIPVLIADDQIIYDSRVIYNFLSKKYQWNQLSLHDENIISAIDGAMDSSINLFLLQRGGLDLNSANSFIERQQKRIEDLFNFLSPWVKLQDAKNNNHWNFPTISLYSYLDWLQLRKMSDFSQHPEMKNFLYDFQNAPGIQETKAV